MTASKTPRLGLMRPTGSDPFLTADFAETFDKLDSMPGTLPIPNESARPTNWGPSQHGCKVLQTDVGAEWFWFQPSSSASGVWKRVGSTGALGSFQNPGSTSTVVPVATQGPTCIDTGPITCPGGKPLQLLFSWDVFGNTYGKAVITLWENNIRVWDKVWGGYLPPYASGGSFCWPRNPAPSGKRVVTYKVTVSSYYALPPHGGGATIMTNSLLTVHEQ